MFSQPAAARDTCLTPAFSRLRRPNGVNFNETAHLLFHQSSASPEWPEALAAPRKRKLCPQRTPGSEAGVCPPLAAKRRELQWNSSSAVPSKFSQPGVARSTCLTPVFVRPWRPNGVNFNGTAHLLFHQSSASPEWPETLTAPRKEISSPQRTPGSEANPVPRHGEPLARVPRGETVHRTVSPPLLSLLTLKFFRSLRAATKDSVFGICDFLKKIE